MHVLRQLWSDSFRRGDFFHSGFPQSVDRPKFPQQQILPVLTHARAIVENAFADPFLHQQLMIGVGETMGFVANALKQTQRAGIVGNCNGKARPGR